MQAILHSEDPIFLIYSSERSAQDMRNRQLPPYQKNWALFFDIDGTLADLASTPEAAQIPTSTLEDLVLIQEINPLALVSGRSLASIDALIFPFKFLAAGQHGLEIRFAGNQVVHATFNEIAMDNIIQKIKSFHLFYPDLVIEYKGLSVAVHYRLRPDLAEVVRNFLASLLKFNESNMCLQRGKMVDEIKLRGGNKGTAIESFMRTPAFRDKTPIFAGDDETDEDAHRVVNALGGISIQIGALSGNANYSLATPFEMRSWVHEISCKSAESRKAVKEMVDL